MSAALAVLLAPTTSNRDRSWEHCRNSLGIARLLVQEGRPETLVATACQMAVESGCRAALEQAGLRYDGDMPRSLSRLAAPPEVWCVEASPGPDGRLRSAERIVSWLAAYLRSEAPDRSWGY